MIEIHCVQSAHQKQKKRQWPTIISCASSEINTWQFEHFDVKIKKNDRQIKLDLMMIMIIDHAGTCILANKRNFEFQNAQYEASFFFNGFFIHYNGI